MLSNEALTIIQQIAGSIEALELISQTHHRVYLAETASGRHVVKEILDPTTRPFIEKAVIDKLAPNDLFCPISHVQRLKESEGSLVIRPYIDGSSLDSVIRKGAFSQEQAKMWASDLHRTFQYLLTVPAEGFGRPTLARSPEFASWTDYLDQYLNRQRDKAPRMAAMRFKQLRDRFESLRNKLDEETPVPHVINADPNARNYLVVSPSNRLRQIHMPNIQHGDPAVPYGDAMIHYHGTPILDELLKLSEFPSWRLHFYAAFAAYAILAFCEQYSSSPLEEAVPWGGDRPLLDLLDENLKALQF